MEILKIILVSLLSLVLIFMLAKVMGNKQISQLNMFDYIIGITIGSIAAEMSTDFEGALKPTIAMVIYGLIAAGVSVVTNHSNSFRAFMTGKPIIMLEKGKLYRERLKKAKIDLNEFLVTARIAGYFDISEIETAVFEENGSFTFLPKAQHKPITPNDMKMPVEVEILPVNIIVDGNIMYKELHQSGKDEKWLDEKLREYGYKSCKEVFLSTLKGEKLTFFAINSEK